MGQYYKVVNLDKRQYLSAHVFNDGLKLMEFGMSVGGMMTGLAILLTDGNGRGGGDLQSENSIVGSWAGDRIVIAGDYADPDRFGVDGTLYAAAEQMFENVSEAVINALLDDSRILRDWANKGNAWHDDILKRDAPTVLKRLRAERRKIAREHRHLSS